MNGISCQRPSVSAATSNDSATKSGAKTSQSSSRLSFLSGLSFLSFALLQKPLLLSQAQISRIVTLSGSATVCKLSDSAPIEASGTKREQPISSLLHDATSPLPQRQAVTCRAAVRIEAKVRTRLTLLPFPPEMI